MEKAKILFGKNDGDEYRIPSIVNADGVLVAAADNGKSGLDWGYIEIQIKRSFDGGESWTKAETIAAPPARSKDADKENTKSAFFIDPCMTIAANGDIIMLATFFPESKGAHNLMYLDRDKFPYARTESGDRPVLYDRSGNYYIVLDNSKVIAKDKSETGYILKDFGELYKGDEYAGNVFLNGNEKDKQKSAGTTFGAPLKAVKRSCIYMLISKDKGKTWSKPKDITPQILLKQDGVFLGVAPGTGLTTSSGRILFPLYTPKGTVCIYSDDNAKTWKRNKAAPYTFNKGEWTLVQAPNGRIYGYGRDSKKIPATVSFDNGLTWAKVDDLPFEAPKCQKNAIVSGNEVFISHPSKNERSKGVLSHGEFAYDKSGTFSGIKWSDDEIKINSTFFAYSCLVKIDGSTLGIMYENKPSGEIVFNKIKI